MKAIDELKDKFYKRPLDYGAFWPLIFPAILDLATRLDEAEKRITELELASPCPMLKSICEDWEYTGKLDGTERAILKLMGVEKSDTRATSPRKDALEGE